NVFGKTVASLEVNPGLHNVLPGSIRRFDIPWKAKFLVGPYHADTKIKYGPQARIITASTLIWFFPWREVLMLVGGLAAAWVIFRLYLRRRDRKIEERVRRRMQR
ncbi:MAG: hypothetical protein ABIS59_00005, partial [Candidatus Saccharibacteria bacterium]